MQSFISYVRSVFLQKDKSVFDVTQLPLEEFALSLGLSKAPKIRFVKKQDKQFGGRDEENAMKKGGKKAQEVEDARVAASSDDDGDESEGETPANGEVCARRFCFCIFVPVCFFPFVHTFQIFFFRLRERKGFAQCAMMLIMPFHEDPLEGSLCCAGARRLVLRKSVIADIMMLIMPSMKTLIKDRFVAPVSRLYLRKSVMAEIMMRIAIHEDPQK